MATKAGPKGLVKALLEEEGVQERLENIVERYVDALWLDEVSKHPMFPQLVFQVAARETAAACRTAMVIAANLRAVGHIDE